MERDQARQLLEQGEELDGLVLTGQGRVIARGKVQWQGTTLSAVEAATCTHLQLVHKGDRLTVPFVNPVPVRQGEAVQIEFGPAWQRQRRRA